MEFLNAIDFGSIIVGLVILLGMVWSILEIIEKLSRITGNTKTEKFAMDAQGRIFQVVDTPLRYAEKFADDKYQHALTTTSPDDDIKWLDVKNDIAELKAMLARVKPTIDPVNAGRNVPMVNHDPLQVEAERIERESVANSVGA